MLGLGDRVDDRVAMSAASSTLPILAHLLDLLDHHRVLVVALELRVDEAGLDAGDPDVGVSALLAQRLGEADHPHLVML